MINILALCDYPEILQIFRLIRIIIGIIRVAVPIIMVMTITMDFATATAKGDDVELKNAFKKTIVKAVAATLIIFLPLFVNIVLRISSADTEYERCLANATTENIEKEYKNRAKKLVEIAKEKLTRETYQTSQDAVNKLSNIDDRKELQGELDVIKPVVEAKELVEKVRQTKKNSDFEKAEEAISKMPDSEYKKQLEEELEEIAIEMNKYLEEYSTDGKYIENPLGLPYYGQCDSRWGGLKYDIGGGPNNTMATFCSSSCGYTSFSMIAAGLNKDMSITPPTVVDKMRGISIASGEYTKRGYGAASTTELMNSTYMSYYNLTANQITAKSGESFKQAIMRELNSGKAAVILVPGHYMVLTASGDGDVILLDPYSNWKDSRRKSGKQTLDNVWNVYDGINTAIAYKKN